MGWFALAHQLHVPLRVVLDMTVDEYQGWVSYFIIKAEE